MLETTAIRKAAVARLPLIIERTRQLVEIDSGSADADGVNEVGRILAADLVGSGFEVDFRAIPGRGDLLDATLTTGVGPTVLVLGHADTVWPRGTVAGWPFGQTDRLLSGPGVGDMKCALVMAIHSISLLHELGCPAPGVIHFLVVPDEELGSIGSRALIEDAGRSADACLTLEAVQPGGRMITGRGAVGAVRIRAHGRTAHCTSPEAGASALSALAPLVAELEALSDPARQVQASVGILAGGTARQVVPGNADLELDLRAPDSESATALLEAVREIVNRPSLVPGVTLELSGGITRPAFPPEASADLFEIAAAAAASLDLSSARHVERGGSDASFVAALGVPTLDGLGPLCHDSCSRRETVERESIADRAAILTALLAAVAAWPTRAPGSREQTPPAGVGGRDSGGSNGRW